jgi:methyltransferase-like protein/SAM-dependent methyltransferase
MMQPKISASLKEPALAEAYSAIAYIGYPFAQTHPDRLATLGALFGLQPAPVGKCRVLELGCGDGGNLIPMAFTLPDSDFVGIDLASAPVERGKEMIAELRLSNIELRCEDIMRFHGDQQSFDYIIAHGVFSWVPQAVRLQMLELCRKLLAPHGVAYISYNCYPGYHLRNLTREMMIFHTRAMTDPKERVQQGLSLLQWLLRKFPDEVTARNDLYGALLTEQLDLLMGHRHREQIYHDDLAAENTPFYFYQFNALAEQHGLQYLGEADYFEMQDFIYPEPIREVLGQFGDEKVVIKEQYLDFLKCRTFRQTLLCHEDAPVRRRIDPALMTKFYFESQARPVSAQPDLRAGVVEEFHGPRGAKLQTDFPPAKAALLALGDEWPRYLSWDEMRQAASARLGIDGTLEVARELDDETRTLSEILLAACGSDLIRLHAQPPQFVTKVSERPVASPLARAQANHGGVVTNMSHKSVDIEDSLSVRLLQLLDGARDHATLCDEMMNFIARGAAFTRPDGTPINDQQEARSVVTTAIEANLRKLAQMALLVPNGKENICPVP